MKAFDIIKTLLDGYMELEQGGVFVMTDETDEQYIQSYFGMKRIVDGKFDVGNYMYFYSPEALKLADDFEPAIILEDNNGQNILLWRIE